MYFWVDQYVETIGVRPLGAAPHLRNRANFCLPTLRHMPITVKLPTLGLLETDNWAINLELFWSDNKSHTRLYKTFRAKFRKFVGLRVFVRFLRSGYWCFIVTKLYGETEGLRVTNHISYFERCGS